MTSAERHEVRYQRRRAKREEKRRNKFYAYTRFDWVFTFHHMMNSARKCRRGVFWKKSVQRFWFRRVFHILDLLEQVRRGQFKSKGFYKFYIHERGKLRFIRSVGIEERVVQKCLCDYCLVPVITNSLIYDNAASQKGKGYHFAMKRLKEHLRHHIHLYGVNGYVVQFDFKSYFESISHDLLKQIVRKYIPDKELLSLIDHFIDCFNDGAERPGLGIGLGSQISQTLALIAASEIDHLLKDRFGLKGYGRYMDDGYALCRTKDEARQVLHAIRETAGKLGLTLSPKKTHIIKLSHGFTYCKKRVLIMPTGRIVMKMARRSIAAERQRLKKYDKKRREGVLTYKDAYLAYQAWRSYAMHYDAYHTVKQMDRLYNKYFLLDIFECRKYNNDSITGCSEKPKRAVSTAPFSISRWFA